MRITSFIQKPGSASTDKPVTAPSVWQESVTFAVGEGDAPVDLLAAIAPGSAAAYGGQVQNDGCERLQLDINYLDGETCDGCPPAGGYTVVAATVYVDAYSVVDLPAGYITGIMVTAVDSADAPVAVQAEQNVSYNACCTPKCTGPVLVPAEG